jgi:hypothetical protein
MARTLDAPLPADMLRRRGGEFSLERSVKRYLKLLLPDEYAQVEKLKTCQE